ncbi:MAG: prolipoprotein diacylglyceryl transferase [Bacilli bacterium]
MNYLASVLPTNIIEIGGVKITFYAVFILLGALIALFISKHEYKKLGGNSSDLDGLFVVSLLSGIVGARVWFVIAEWSRYFAGQPWYKVFYVWEGGLAIQGGAIVGILVGVIYVYFVLKPKCKATALEITDCIVPTMLLAQAIGRIGNFFNREVYGKVFDYSKTIFAKFPQWFINQMQIEMISSNGEAVTYFEGITDPATQMVHPLFLYEALFNILGFIVLFFVLHKLMKKILVPGVVCGAYFIWYGVTRIIMEPWRNSKFIMGDNDGVMSSRIMAFTFLGIGAAIIIASIVLYFVMKHKRSIKVIEKQVEDTLDEPILTRQEVGITKYATPEQYKAHDFSGLEASDILTEEDIKEAENLVKEDEEKVDDFIVIEGPELVEEDILPPAVEEEKEVVQEPVEEEEPYEPRVLEIEEGDYVAQSKINKFVEKNKEVMEDYLDGYRNPYSPASEKNVLEQENEEVEASIVVEEEEEVSTFNGEKIITFKNGFGDSSFDEEEKVELEKEEKNVVEIEEGDYEDLSKINKFVEKDEEVEASILDGYRNPYSPATEKNVQESMNEEVEETIDIDIEEDVPSIGEISLEFKNCPPPVRSDGTVSTPIGLEKKKRKPRKKKKEVEVEDIPDVHQENEVVLEEKEEVEEEQQDL